MTWYSSVCRRKVWGIVIVILLLLATGCARHASHGIHKHGQKKGSPTSVGSQKHSSPAAMKKEMEKELNGLNSGGEGYFPEGSGNFSDLLEEDLLLHEDQQLGTDASSSLSGNDYWVNRTRAEQLTAQSGLQDIHFKFNSFHLDEQAKAALGANAEWLKAHPHAEVTIEGHCDDRGTASYNHVLGEKRAMRAKNYLTRLGVSPDRLHVMSFGKENPVCWDSTESCYQKNRRAHLVLDISVASTAISAFSTGPNRIQSIE